MARALSMILCCPLALALAPATAGAMCIDISYRVMAFSSDGESVLLEENGFGPEGGGSLAYLLLSGAHPWATRFVVTSNYSPGDGSTPETISVAALQKTLRGLAEAVKRKKLLGVQVGAAGAQRGGLVTIQPAAAKAVTTLRAVRDEIAAGSLRITIREKRLAIADRDGGSPMLTLWEPIDSLRGVSASIAPGGKLLVLRRDNGRCSRDIAVLHTRSGRSGDLRHLSLPTR